MAASTDILMTFPIVGEAKLKRLTALAKRIRMSAVTDSTEVADAMARAASGAGVRVELLVECDTGTGRCGVQSADEAVALAERIANTRGVDLRRADGLSREGQGRRAPAPGSRKRSRRSCARGSRRRR